MNHGNRACVVKVKQEVAIGNRVKGIGDHAIEAQFVGCFLAIERIRGASKRRRAQRIGVGGIECLLQASKVTSEHPVVSHEMVRKEHGLSMLHVRIARQNGAHILASSLDERLTHGIHVCHELGSKLLSIQASVGDYLVVAAAAGVQASARITDILSKHLFHGHVDVFIVDVEGEVTLFDGLFDIGQARNDVFGVFFGNYALRCQHTCMSAGAGNILMIHCLINRKGCAEFLCEFAYTLFKTSRPQRHNMSS